MSIYINVCSLYSIEKVSSSLEIEYMVTTKTNKYSLEKSEKNNNVVVGPMTKLIKIMDDKKNIVTEKFNSFLFDISSYERYPKILTSFCAWIKNRTAKIENFDEFTDKKDVKLIKKHYIHQ